MDPETWNATFLQRRYVYYARGIRIRKQISNMSPFGQRR